MKTHNAIVPKIIEMIQRQQLPVGAHLAAQKIADHIRVSRSPVNDALRLLCESGVVVRRPNRGYFLARNVSGGGWNPEALAHFASEDPVTKAYFALADELLAGALPLECSETLLKSRYGLTAAQTQTLLRRIAGEGWARRRPGYGWEFLPMMTTPESLLQSYRLRLALEPAALLEPGYAIAPDVIERCRQAEYHLLNGGIDTDSADQLHDRGVRFHESIIEASGNPYFIDAIRRVNQVRRLLSYQSMKDRERYREHCAQHLHILDLLEKGKNAQAAKVLHAHLEATVKNLSSIRSLLGPPQ